MVMRPTWLVVLLLSLCVCCPAQTTLPDTPAGHQLSAWLEAFNRGDRDTFLAFVQKNLPARAKNIDQDMDFRKNTGGFDLRKVEEATSPTRIVALVQEHNSDQFGRLVIEVEP